MSCWPTKSQWFYHPSIFHPVQCCTAVKAGLGHAHNFGTTYKGHTHDPKRPNSETKPWAATTPNDSLRKHDLSIPLNYPHTGIFIAHCTSCSCNLQMRFIIIIFFFSWIIKKTGWREMLHTGRCVSEAHSFPFIHTGLEGVYQIKHSSLNTTQPGYLTACDSGIKSAHNLCRLFSMKNAVNTVNQV